MKTTFFVLLQLFEGFVHLFAGFNNIVWGLCKFGKLLQTKLRNTLNNIFVSAIWCNRFCLFLSCVTFCGPPIVECGRKAVRVKAPVHPHLMSMGGREGQPPDFTLNSDQISVKS